MTINQNLAVLFVGIYNNFKAKGIAYIPNTEVAKIVMISTYNSFVRNKEIKPIEELPEEEKKRLVAECREMKKDYTNTTLIEQVKVLYVIENINCYS